MGEKGLLFVVDGSKAIAAAVQQVFGERALVQRCQVHYAEGRIMPSWLLQGALRAGFGGLRLGIILRSLKAVSPGRSDLSPPLDSLPWLLPRSSGVTEQQLTTGRESLQVDRLARAGRPIDGMQDLRHHQGLLRLHKRLLIS